MQNFCKGCGQGYSKGWPWDKDACSQGCARTITLLKAIRDNKPVTLIDRIKELFS